jgi:hypothetical protein
MGRGHLELRLLGQATRNNAADMHNLALPMLLPGITISTSPADFAPVKQMQLLG